MANIGYSAPNDMIAIICERVDNGNKTYTIIPNAVSFGRVENNMFRLEDNTAILPNIEDRKALENPEIKTFYVFAKPINEVQQYYNMTNLEMLAVCYYTDIKKKVILALNEGGYIQVVSDDLDNFMADICRDNVKALNAKDYTYTETEYKSCPELFTTASGEVDLTRIDNFAMESYIKERIFENDETIEDICTTVAMNYAAKHARDIEAMLSIGPTGSGKTETYKLIAEYLGVPLTIYDSTSITAAGYVGKDIDDVLKTVYVNSNGDKAKAEKSILVFDEIDKLAMRGSDVKDEQVQNALLKVLDGHKYSVSLEKGGKSVEIDTSFMTIAGLGAFPDIFKNKKKSKNNKIGFSSGETESEETDLLTVTTEELVKFGMLAELIGRFSDTYVYKELTKDNLRRILLESKNSPLLLKINRYLTDFNTSVEYDNGFIDAIVEKAYAKHTGGRALKRVVSESLKKCDRALLSLRAHDGDKPKTLKLTKDTVENHKRFTI